jgi:hypothetical protein
MLSRNRSYSSLSATEQEVLNRAAVEYFSDAYSTPQNPSSAASPAAASPADEHDDEDELGYDERGRLVPLQQDEPLSIEAPPTFWWRTGPEQSSGVINTAAAADTEEDPVRRKP